ncbi:MAG: SUMF1/EgtB/PvdO family nonheme iron enzyme [Leptolyngbyaceae cyanobacterium SL_7_1]|nr:SUMF1/EgtB/PvdO family nonheme iron enzyme [Leptolyngbyaceae cyanobacterium SL_7_1]
MPTSISTDWITSSKKNLNATHYLRYVDDFALLSDDRQFLADARLQIETYLTTLRLKIHPIKSQLFETRHGATFLGFRVLPDRIRVRTENLRRAKRRLRRLQSEYQHGNVSQSQLAQSLQSWFAHLDQGNTWQLKQIILNPSHFRQNSHCPVKTGKTRGRHFRLLRGGSWNNNPRNCRSANRNRNNPDNRNNNIGFRVVCGSACALQYQNRWMGYSLGVSKKSPDLLRRCG